MTSSEDSGSEVNKYAFNKSRRKQRNNRSSNKSSTKQQQHPAAYHVNNSDDEDDVISPLIRPFANFLNQTASSASSLLGYASSGGSGSGGSTKFKLKSYRNLNHETSTNNNPSSNSKRTATTTSAASSPSPSDLVLIKYKQSNEESSYNSLRTSQLQKKREVQSLLLFIFFLFITIITLSQILVMHSQTNNSNFHQVKLMQEELKLMDLSIDKMLKEKHVLPIQVWFALKQYNDNLRKFSRYMSVYIYSNGTNAFAYTSYFNNSGDTYHAGSFIFDTNSKRVASSSLGSGESEATNLATISQDLAGELKKCAAHLELAFLDAADKTDTAQATSTRQGLRKVYTKLSRRVYTRMLDSLRNLNSSSREKGASGAEFLNFTAYEPMLNDYLNMTSRVMGELSEASQHSQRKCVQNLFYSLYYYFNAKFSILFERHLARVQLPHNGTAAFDNELIDETVRAIRANYFMFNRNVPLNDTDDLHLLQMPIRNVNDYVRKYRQSKNKFNPNKTLCDPIPPVLCKHNLSFFSFDVTVLGIIFRSDQNFVK
jgi:hypothetical protein